MTEHGEQLLTNKEVYDIVSRPIPIDDVFNMNYARKIQGRAEKGKPKKLGMEKTELIIENGFNNYCKDGIVYFSDFGFDGIARLESERVTLFGEKGVNCVCCGLRGTHFKKDTGRDSKFFKKAIEDPTKNKYTLHINLYADYNGRDILMTKDHIIPKILGGKNHISNYDVCCTECNGLKSNYLDSFENIKKLIMTTNSASELLKVFRSNQKDYRYSFNENTYKKIKKRIEENYEK